MPSRINLILNNATVRSTLSARPTETDLVESTLLLVLYKPSRTRLVRHTTVSAKLTVEVRRRGTGLVVAKIPACCLIKY